MKAGIARAVKVILRTKNTPIITANVRIIKSHMLSSAKKITFCAFLTLKSASARLSNLTASELRHHSAKRNFLIYWRICQTFLSLVRKSRFNGAFQCQTMMVRLCMSGLMHFRITLPSLATLIMTYLKIGQHIRKLSVKTFCVSMPAFGQPCC